MGPHRAPASEPNSGGRPEKHSRREIVNAILYVVRSGCPWRYRPHRSSPLADRVRALPAAGAGRCDRGLAALPAYQTRAGGGHHRLPKHPGLWHRRA
ncbi:transposase [Nonomuraea sp. NPDC050328]|uniref:transposase n=1 Tax=Nonomuraea sp. NPDC050328 TaxID=3364361 RepID=UPI00378F3766